MKKMITLTAMIALLALMSTGCSELTNPVAAAENAAVTHRVGQTRGR